MAAARDASGDHGPGTPGHDGRDRRPGPLTQAMSKIDPLGWWPALGSAALHASLHPLTVATATGRFWGSMARIPLASLSRYTARPVDPPVPLNPKDRRFSDPAWTKDPLYFGLRQGYAAMCRYVEELVRAGTHDEVDDAKVTQVTRLVLSGLSPTNFPLTNPTSVSRAIETGGRSWVDGAALALDDLVKRKGRPLKVDRSKFELGRNMAATPGKVVYRNELMELVQYAPQTARVHEIPVLMSPPWINKFYVMDLAPGRSFVEWAVQHGRTVFMISYRNPDSSMRDVRLDDYFESGPSKALDVVQAITGAPRVDVVGLCLGGAMAAMTAANLAARDEDDRIGTLTLLNTLLDYSKPGELGAMTDPASLRRVQARMAETGFLSGDDMSFSFDLLRPDSLIFNYVVSRWLLGEESPSFDILAWNEDSTRMPAAMHTEYLTTLYEQNLLARGEMTLGGEDLELGKVRADTYVVGAINDHIVPWTSSYAAVALLGGDVRYVLSSGGHIAGIVNPPSPKAWFEAAPGPSDGQVLTTDPARWREGAERHAGTWWEDWTAWSSPRAGDLVEPPAMGGGTVLGDAPGDYVRE